MKKYLNRILGIIVFLVLVCLDQITKHLAVLHLKGQNPIVIVKNVFQLNYLENHGAAFSILQGKQIPLLIITVIVLAFVIYAFLMIPNEVKFRGFRIFLVLIASGAAGNMIDRVTNHYVVDFFYFELIDFPIFNVADIYVTVAAILLILLVLFKYKEKDLNDILIALKLKKAGE